MLSFVIPTYKPSIELLKKNLKALIGQSLKEWEAIVVLDGPNDEAKLAIEALKSSKVKVFEIEHGGVQKARNYGFAKSKGEFVCFWDADCLIEPCAAKTWIDTFKAEPDKAFVYSGYKFLDEQGGIPSEPFDPWLLECGNYISTCFPMRREVFPGFDESLISLQDWDMWLTIVKNGGKGRYIPGYAFSTAYPTTTSISGKNCTNEVWLDRVKAVKTKHNLPDRKICVSSISYKEEGIRLAKLINADYKDVPNYKPNNYDTIIQVGFSLHPGRVATHSAIFNQALKKKIIFFTMADVTEINNFISHKAIALYAERLNTHTKMYVEDLAAKRIMESAGFIVEILPIPLVNTDKIDALPEDRRVLVDITPEYRDVMVCLEHSLPDVTFDFLTHNKPVKDYCAMLALNPEKTMTFEVKRMLLAGRNIISNIEAPFCGYVNDNAEAGVFVSGLVNTIRKRIKRSTGPSVDFWAKEHQPTKLDEVLK
jgi:glycosyltransferase involved in cell wall biosynthesis